MLRILSRIFGGRERKNGAESMGHHDAHRSDPNCLTTIDSLEALISEAMKYGKEEDFLHKAQYALDLTDQEKDHIFTPLIQAFADYVQLIPASRDHHHSFYGGLLLHSLEVGYLCARASGKVVLFADSPQKRMEMEKRWRVGAFLVGLFHDVGKVYTNVIVTSDKGRQWNPLKDGPISSWLESHNAGCYFISWENEKKYGIHERYNIALMHAVLGGEIGSRLTAYLSEYDKALLEEIHLSVSGSGEDLAMAKFAMKADMQSVKRYQEGNDQRFRVQQQSYVPLGRFVAQAIQRSSELWQANQPGAQVYLSDQGQIYVAWRVVEEQVQRHLQQILQENGIQMECPVQGLLDHLSSEGEITEGKSGEKIIHINPRLSASALAKLNIPAIKLNVQKPWVVELIRSLKVDGIPIEEHEAHREQNADTKEVGSDASSPEVMSVENEDGLSEKRPAKQDPIEQVRKQIPSGLASLSEVTVELDEVATAAAPAQTEDAAVAEAPEPPPEFDQMTPPPHDGELPDPVGESEPSETVPSKAQPNEQVTPPDENSILSPETKVEEANESDLELKVQEGGWSDSLFQVEESSKTPREIARKTLENFKDVALMHYGEGRDSELVLKLVKNIITGKDELGKYLVKTKRGIGVRFPEALSLVGAQAKTDRADFLQEMEQSGMIQRDQGEPRIRQDEGFKYFLLAPEISRRIIEFLMETNRYWDPEGVYWHLLKQETLRIKPKKTAAPDQGGKKKSATRNKNVPLREIIPNTKAAPKPKGIQRPSDALRQLAFQARVGGGAYITQPYLEYTDHFVLPRSVLDVIRQMHGFDENTLKSTLVANGGKIGLSLIKDGIRVDKQEKSEDGKEAG